MLSSSLLLLNSSVCISQEIKNVLRNAPAIRAEAVRKQAEASRHQQTQDTEFRRLVELAEQESMLEEVARRIKEADEVARKQREAEEAARRQQLLQKQAAAEEAERQRKLEDDRRKQQAADEAARRQQLLQKQAAAEELERQRKLEDDLRKQQAADEAVRRQQLLQKQAETEEAARRKKEADEVARKQREAEVEAARRQQQKREADEAARIKKEADDRARKQKEDEEVTARRTKEAEEALVLAATSNFTGLTSDQVGDLVMGLGDDYKEFKPIFVRKGFTGALVAQAMDDNELFDYLKEVGVTSKLQQKAIEMKFRTFYQPSKSSNTNTVPITSSGSVSVNSVGGSGGGSSSNSSSGSGVSSSTFSAAASFPVQPPQPGAFAAFMSAVKIPRRELDLQNKISFGATCMVYKGTWRGTNVAVKILRADRGDKAYQELERELSVLVHIRHDRVVNLMGMCEELQDIDGGNVALITQLMVRGSLYFVLHNQSATAISYRPRSLEMRLQLSKDVAEAMRFLHASRVLHCDLKSENVLVDDDGRAKVADFGMSKFNRESMSRVTAALGTWPWTAPELLQGDKTQRKSADVYGFGVIVWELFTGEVPWENMNGIQITSAVGYNGERLSIPNDLSRDHPVVSDLITACFRDEANRPTFHELYSALDRLLTHTGPSSSGDPSIAALSQKMDVFIKLSQEQFEMVSDLHAGGNLMPHTYVILPRLNENKGILGWLTSNAASLLWDQSRLHFFCRVTCKFVPCGVDGEGYPLSIPHDWLLKLAPALQFGVSLLKVLVVTRGLADTVDLSSLVPASSSSASSLETLGKMLTCMKKFASGIEDATGEDPLDYLTQTIEGLSADEDAKSAHALVYRFLAKAELNGSDPYPGWKPQLTGLGTEAITPIGGGKSLWVSPEGRDAYLQQGMQAVRSNGSNPSFKTSSSSSKSGAVADPDVSPSTLVNPTGQHIMISYCWTQKVLVTALAVYLREKHGYDVWIDEVGSTVCGKMSGASDAKMAEAVEKSHTVVVFVSKEYNASVNCQKEAKYAHQRRDKGKVKIHYVMMQREYTTVSKPDCIEGALALWIGDEIWYSLFEESQVVGTGDSLADLIGEQGKLIGTSI